MTEREKAAHVLRRFGLGAGRYPLKGFEGKKHDEVVSQLLEYEATDEKFTVTPWSFAVQPDGKYYADPYQIGAWWALRLVMTRRPFQEKLAVFWHDHFAVSGEKVFEGSTMLAYSEVLRKHGAGKFRDLLRAVAKQGALIGYLDANTSTKSRPNENFAREMLELFTLGAGHYTEKDVTEAARAFTGWSLHFSGIGDETPYEKQVERAARQGMSLFNFCTVPAHHDAGEKQVLGRKGNLDGDDLIDLLADRPETARHICRKLWEFFAYPEPEEKTLAPLLSAWRASDGEVRAVVRAIAKSPAFWSEKCVRQSPKSPVDYTVAMFRALGLEDVLLALQGNPKDAYTPVRDELRKAGLGVFYLMAQQGLTLFFPPNVGGWEWGDAWITSTNTLTRVNHSSVLFWGDDAARPIALYLAGRLRSEDEVASGADVVDALADVFDVPLGSSDRDLLIEACGKAGGPAALGAGKDQAAHLLASLTKLMFALPKFQLC